MIERYSRPPLTELWSATSRYQAWLRVELAVTRGMEEAGLVPAGVADAVAGRVKLDPARILEIEETVRHDVIAFLLHVEEQAGEEARWLHFGMTSSDVLDTSLALLMCEAADHLMAGVDRVLAALEVLARRHARTPMVGRTHGIHAEPTTAGLVFALWYSEMGRNRERLERAREGVRVGKVSGAVGTYAGGVPPEVEAAACESIGLEAAAVTNQVVQRDRHAEYLSVLALTAASIEKMAVTIRHWQRTEVREAEEPFFSGQRGSSAMPHKRNPILTENLCGLARLVRSYAGAGFENVALWHERDISHSSVERVAIPDATTLLDFMLHRVSTALEGLTVNAEQMAHNLNLTGGSVFSGGVLLALCRAGLARGDAYALVQRNAMTAWESGSDLLEILLEDEEITAVLGRDGVERCFDLETHLARAETIVARVLPPREES